MNFEPWLILVIFAFVLYIGRLQSKRWESDEPGAGFQTSHKAADNSLKKEQDAGSIDRLLDEEARIDFARYLESRDGGGRPDQR